MGRIIILDEGTTNKIAAGEVIEKPASVIKELVENSMDSGAGIISVEIRNGGITYIKISDNGCGIYDDDAEIAFERHATSKIRNASDLEGITSMGFRGEALSSIAAVSSVQLVSRVSGNNQGINVSIRGGRVEDVKPAGCPVGTTITVKDLFYNTPARFKFLKKDSTEAGYISDIISRLALGNPHISFSLTSNGSSVLQTPGNSDQLSTIFSIYGRDTAKGVYPVDYTEGTTRLTGFVGKPEIARSNRNQQSVFVNRRYVRNKTVSSAIDAAYGTFLMKNKYAFAVLNIELNPMLVDINVHPAKTEVKFANEQDIFKAVYNAVYKALIENSGIRTIGSEIQQNNPTFIFNPERRKDAESEYSQTSIQQPIATQPITIQPIVIKPITTQTINTQSITTQPISIQPITTQPITRQPISIQPAACNLPPSCDQPPSYSQPGNLRQSEALEPSGSVKNPEAVIQHEMFAETIAAYTPSDPSVMPSSIPKASGISRKNDKFDPDSFSYIGQAFSTFLVLQDSESLILVDQHAAHERILYEKIKNDHLLHTIPSQMLLSGISIELAPQEMLLLDAEKSFFVELGFEYEVFGNNSVLLRSVPSDTQDNAKVLFREILDLLISGSRRDKAQTTDEVLFRIACKAAVKANKKLTEQEVRQLLLDLMKMENPFTCPHGRPSMFKVTRHELEKIFKRIV